jgi:hypothetical protein
MAIWDAISGLVTGLVSPITGLLQKKEERKEHHNMAMAALQTAKQEDATHVTLEAQAYETVLASAMEKSWKDEFITVIFGTIIIQIMVAGMLVGLGYPAFMDGTVTGINALAVVIDLKFIMTAVCMSAIGLSVWRKI